MSQTDTPGIARIRRQIANEHNALVASGDFSALLLAWRHHVTRWDGAPDPFSETLMRDGLCAAALHLSSRLRNETLAWTLNLLHPPRNLFLTGSSAAGTVTGRATTEGVLVGEQSRLFVQTYRPRQEPHTSVTDVLGLDLLDILEQFYSQSEQLPARFFRLPEESYLAVHALPGVDRDWILSLDGATARALAEAAPVLEERIFRFECGCTREKMLRAVQPIFREDPAELFHGESKVEVACPRCGRRWWLSREGF